MYFDNVGGDLLEAVLSAMRPHGRIVACGAVSGYNDDTLTPGPRNMFLFTSKRLTMKGFMLADWLDRLPEFVEEAKGYLADGRLRTLETVVEGIERAPQALLDLLHGENVGKMVVMLADGTDTRCTASNSGIK